MEQSGASLRDIVNLRLVAPDASMSACFGLGAALCGPYLSRPAAVNARVITSLTSMPLRCDG
jgi:hypothetical protein